MLAISFGWTSAAIRAGVKTCTRREWKPGYAALFHAGQTVLALDKDRRYGGKPICEIVLTADPVQSSDYPPEDFTNEGFAYLESRGFSLRIRGRHIQPRALWRSWRQQRPTFWVIRFDYVPSKQAPLPATLRPTASDQAEPTPYTGSEGKAGSRPSQEGLRA